MRRGAASKRGIYVSNCPGKNSIAVAELAFALILALDRRIADNVIALRKGEWNKKEFSKARGLYGRTLGLIGVGKIGQEMIPRARAFGMPVVAWSRSLTLDRAALLGVAYSLGLGVPFLATALAINRFFSAFAAIRRHYHTIEIVSGALLVVIGVLIFTDRFTVIAQWLTPYLPVY